MANKSLKQLIESGAFIAFGVVLPMVFHLVGMGSVFLPMHIPVILSGFFLDVPFALMVGAITPILSSTLTGMPPAFPVLPFMVFELAAYGAVTSLLYKKWKNVFTPLICAMISGRIVAGIVVWFLATFFAAKLPGPIVFITGAILKGIPGIIIQLLFIPATVLLVSRNRLHRKEKSVG